MAKLARLLPTRHDTAALAVMHYILQVARCIDCEMQRENESSAIQYLRYACSLMGTLRILSKPCNEWSKEEKQHVVEMDVQVSLVDWQLGLTTLLTF